MSKEKIDKNKPHVNIGTIGKVDYSKESLNVAIEKVLTNKDSQIHNEYNYIDKQQSIKPKQKTFKKR